MPPQVLSITAELFALAVERVASRRGQTVVVKLGGSALEDAACAASCLRSIATLHLLGIPIVLIHGGGKPIDRAMAEAGLIPRKVAGRRYTDDETLGIVVRVLREEINPEIVSQLKNMGCQAVVTDRALHGTKLQIVAGDGKLTDLGRVGSVTHVSSDVLNSLVRQGHLPVLPSLALDETGAWLNVNADTAASAVAGSLQASQAIFLTDTPGVLLDRANPLSRYSRLTKAECHDLIASGVIDGGMVPKVEACFEALAAGAREALILDGRVPYSLLDLFLHDCRAGTIITP